MVTKIYFICNLQRCCLRLMAFKGDRPVFGFDVLYPFELFQKIEVPVAAAEFPVRHGFEANFYFFIDQLRNFFVFNLTQTGWVQCACRCCLACFFDAVCP